MINSNRFNKNDYLILPSDPGVYKFFDKENKIIYVGKAKNLKKRVSSYFTKKNYENRKTLKLLTEIQSIEFVQVSSEFDALLLENNLIKSHQPKFNILLKDDKSFPSIIITNERFPRVFATRRINKNDGQYFGPYSSVKSMNNVLDLTRKLYHIRTCKFNLSEKNIKQKRFKICLEYHIGNCKGPCEGLQDEVEYLDQIKNLKSILNGKSKLVARTFKEKMNEEAQKLNFEHAAIYKEKLLLLEKFQSNSIIVNQNGESFDVCTIINDSNDRQFINYIKIIDGSIANSETVYVNKKIDEKIDEIFRYTLFELRLKYNSKNKLIITNQVIEPWEKIEIIIPKIGDKKKLIDLSIKNALIFKKSISSIKPIDQSTETLVKLQDDLKLTTLPKHIECFDNSNIQGTNPVASMVCFLNGKPAKKEYRKYNIKTVEGPDDFGSMKEIVLRRYNYLKNNNLEFPNLIVIDGGKGQLNAAIEALKELELYGAIPIIGIAKRLEEIYFPGDELPIHLNKKSSSLFLLQKIRNEAHRFAITFHRNKRSKESLQTGLENVNGIGDKTANKLLSKFKSIKRIKEGSEKDIISLIGKSKTKILFNAIEKGLI